MWHRSTFENVHCQKHCFSYFSARQNWNVSFFSAESAGGWTSHKEAYCLVMSWLNLLIKVSNRFIAALLLQTVCLSRWPSRSLSSTSLSGWSAADSLRCQIIPLQRWTVLVTDNILHSGTVCQWLGKGLASCDGRSCQNDSPCKPTMRDRQLLPKKSHEQVETNDRYFLVAEHSYIETFLMTYDYAI